MPDTLQCRNADSARNLSFTSYASTLNSQKSVILLKVTNGREQYPVCETAYVHAAETTASFKANGRRTCAKMERILSVAKRARAYIMSFLILENTEMFSNQFFSLKSCHYDYNDHQGNLGKLRTARKLHWAHSIGRRNDHSFIVRK